MNVTLKKKKYDADVFLDLGNGFAPKQKTRHAAGVVLCGGRFKGNRKKGRKIMRDKQITEMVLRAGK